MENVSATTQTDLSLAGPGNPPSAGRSLVAQELAHQWFGDQWVYGVGYPRLRPLPLSISEEIVEVDE